MKKLLFTAAIAVSAFATAFAQSSNYKPVTYSLGVHFGIPTGDLSTISGFGFGFTAQGEYKVVEGIGLTGSAGFMSYSGKKVALGSSLTYPSVSQVPVLAGARIYFNDRVYASGQLGLSFYSDGLGTGFTYAPGIGTKLNNNFDATLRYQAASVSGGTLSSLDLRIAYNF